MKHGLFNVFIKNMKEIKYSIQMGDEIYTFSQRKKDRLVGLFFLSSLVNVGIVTFG